MMYSTIGKLRYSINDNIYKAVLEVDPEISNYYFSLIPKYIDINRPRYKPHITVCRPYKEIPKNLEYWGKYEGEEIEVFYSPIVRSGQFYFWLDFFSVRLEDIKLELGLIVDGPFGIPPKGYRKFFHMTLGNRKGFVNES